MLNALELFSGAGGSTTGLIQAGYNILLAVEWEKNADLTAKAAGHPSVCRDVRDLGLYDGLEGKVDVLWASPPCQAWSSAGKRLGASDERNGWPWAFDVIDHVKPRWIIAENVPGLLSVGTGCLGNNPTGTCCPGHYWERVILPSFRERFAWVGHAVLDAADFGVPQHRERVFTVAGPRFFNWPQPTHGKPTSLDVVRGIRKPWVTVRQALCLDLETIGQTNPETARGGNRWQSPDEPPLPSRP